MSTDNEANKPTESATQLAVSDEPAALPARPRRGSVVFLLACALIGLVASAALVLSEIQSLRLPKSHLACDINPLVGCSTSLLSWQAHLAFDIPNALLGAILFAGVSTLFLVWLQVNPARWLLLALEAGLSAGLLLVLFFLYHSLVTFRALCPFCLIVWTVTILIWIHLAAQLMRLGWLFDGTRFAHFWVTQRWLLSVIILLLIVLVVAVTLSDKLYFLF